MSSRSSNHAATEAGSASPPLSGVRGMGVVSGGSASLPGSHPTPLGGRSNHTRSTDVTKFDDALDRLAKVLPPHPGIQTHADMLNVMREARAVIDARPAPAIVASSRGLPTPLDCYVRTAQRDVAKALRGDPDAAERVLADLRMVHR